MTKEVTTTEIMDFLQEHVATKEDLKDGLTGLEKRIRVDMTTKEDLGKLEHKVLDAMDDKLANLKGDLIVLMRKEDRKMATLINILAGKHVITTDEAKIVLALEPFPQS